MSENKKKSWFRKSDAFIAAFLVPVLVLLIIYVQRGVFPFGDRAYLKTDMYHQYAPFFSEFRNKLINGGSLLYSWNVGMGVNFVPIIAYYLASPFNWFLALVPAKHIIEFMDYGIIVKSGLAGLAMVIYLDRHSENSSFAQALCAVFYALSGYMAAYSWNVMWMDCIVLFPLVCLGIEKIVNEKKGLLYAITLGICIVTNYYISIMICIFAVIYLIMLLILKGKQSFGSFAGTVCIFAVFSLLAGGVAAILWIPQLYAVSMTASGEFNFPETVRMYFPVMDEIARHMVNVATEQELNYWPNIYCGVAVFPLVLMFLANRKISLKEKIVFGCAALFMLVSFSLNILSFFWHGLHYPNSLPSRQSFIYIFLMIYICFRTIDNLEGNTVKDIGIAAVVSVAFIFLCQKLVTDDAFEWSTWYLSIGFVAIYSLLLYLYRSGKMNVNFATFLLLTVVAIEASVNMTMTGIHTTSRTQYVEDNDDVRAVVRFVKDDRDFYRFEKNRRKTKDDGAWMNFHSVSLFASTAHADITKLYTQLGCEASTNAYCINGSTPLVDALFDIKYAIYTGKSEDPHQKAVCSSGNTKLYKNEYCLPLGYVIPSDLEKKWILDTGSPVLTQNQLCEALKTDKVLVQVDGFKDRGIYSFTVPEDGLYYAFSENKATDKIKVSNGDTTRVFENVDRGYLLELGWLHKNAIIDFESQDDTETFVHAYRFDYAALGQVADVLSAQPMKVASYDDTHVYAGMDITDEGPATVMTTIPFDPGWTVLVDGKPAETFKVLDAFIGFTVAAGHHDIDMRFWPQGLTEGAEISAACILALIIIAIITLIVYLVQKRKKENEVVLDVETLELALPSPESVPQLENSPEPEAEPETEPEPQPEEESNPLSESEPVSETEQKSEPKPEEESEHAPGIPAEDESEPEPEEAFLPRGISHSRKRHK